MIYRFLRVLFSLALQVFFRRIEVEGRQNVPKTGPVLLVPNHPNALVDALVVLASLKRPVSLTAKSTLADNLLLKLLMDTAHVVPLYRKQDQEDGADRARNVDALMECRRRLTDGGAVMIFPEGQSHSDPSLRPFRWGAARLALQCVSGPDPVPLRIVPVGLHFPEKERIRHDAWVRFGDPIDAVRWREDHPDGGPEELTALIEEQVRDLTLNFDRRSDEVLMNWAAGLLATEGSPPAVLGREEQTTARRLALARRIRNGHQSLRDRKGSEIRALRRRIGAYRSRLKALGIAPAEVYILMDRALAARFVLREGVILGLGFPLVFWGLLNHAPPLAATRLVERKLTRERDQVASNAIFPAVVLFPLHYALVLTAAWLWLPAVWAMAYTASLPSAGVFAVVYYDRARGAWRRARTYLRFRREPDLKRDLEREGRAIMDALVALDREQEEGTDEDRETSPR